MRTKKIGGMDLIAEMGNSNNSRSSQSSKTVSSLSETAVAVSDNVDLKNKLRIVRLDTRIDNEPTHIDESSASVLKYRTPNFRASAVIEIAPLQAGEMWKIGWIQACTDMLFQNTYGDEGHTAWEFPELTSGKQSMISDCDGRHYPWYGSRNETVVFQGPCDMFQRASIVMNDNFHPHVTWRNPANRNQVEPNLTHIIRDQSFYVWLVVWDMTSLKSYILKTIFWNMKLEINICPLNPLGQRALLVSDPVPQQPSILDTNVPIPRCALTPPNANSAQMLISRPRKGKPVCIIPPVWKSDVPWEKQIYKIDSKL